MERQRTQPNLWKDKDYRSEAGLETRGMTGEQSFSKAETEGSDELNEQGKLLEAILSRNNMNMAYKRLKEKMRKLTSRSNAMSIEQRIKKLSSLVTSWTSYFRLSDMKKYCQELDEWMHRRIRMCHWKN
jgi:chromatin segregation and condensation protein Rec8/ScpA/Scc1 (kleisin family)